MGYLLIKSGKLRRGNKNKFRTRFAADTRQVVHCKGPAVDKTIHKGRSLISDLFTDFFKESVLAVSPTGHGPKDRFFLQFIAEILDATVAGVSAHVGKNRMALRKCFDVTGDHVVATANGSDRLQIHPFHQALGPFEIAGPGRILVGKVRAERFWMDVAGTRDVSNEFGVAGGILVVPLNHAGLHFPCGGANSKGKWKRSVCVVLGVASKEFRPQYLVVTIREDERNIDLCSVKSGSGKWRWLLELGLRHAAQDGHIR